MHFTYRTKGTCSQEILFDVDGKTVKNIEFIGGFTLRCLQRLSVPHIAAQLCHWRDNWCTRGASIPVLSY